jgi:hypothetical protein
MTRRWTRRAIVAVLNWAWVGVLAFLLGFAWYESERRVDAPDQATCLRQAMLPVQKARCMREFR